MSRGKENKRQKQAPLTKYHPYPNMPTPRKKTSLPSHANHSQNTILTLTCQPLAKYHPYAHMPTPHKIPPLPSHANPSQNSIPTLTCKPLTKYHPYPHMPQTLETFSTQTEGVLYDKNPLSRCALCITPNGLWSDIQKRKEYRKKEVFSCIHREK